MAIIFREIPKVLIAAGLVAMAAKAETEAKAKKKKPTPAKAKVKRGRPPKDKGTEPKAMRSPQDKMMRKYETR